MSMENTEERQAIIDEEHLRLLSLFHYIKGGITVGFSLFGLFYFMLIAMFTKAASQAELPPGDLDNQFPVEFFSYFLMIVGVMVALTLVFGLLQFLSGYYIRRNRNRLFSLIIGIIECIEIPYGTALGVMTIIVLSRYSVKRRYEETLTTNG